MDSKNIPQSVHPVVIAHAVLAKWVKGLTVALVIALVLGLGVVTIYRAVFSPKHRSDFTVYTAAGTAVLHGGDIYASHNERGLAYVYPPPFAIFAALLALLPPTVGALLWYCIAVGVTVWSLRMCLEMGLNLHKDGRSAFKLYVLAGLSIVPWFIQGAAEGQATMLMSWLIVAAFYWHHKNHEIAGAGCLGAAILLKVFPVLLFGYFALRRQWRFLIISIIALLVGGLLLPAMVFGWQKSGQYWREWLSLVAMPSLGNDQDRIQSHVNKQLLNPYRIRSQTLQSVWWRLVGGETARPIAFGMALIMAAAMALVLWKYREGSDMLVISAFLIWMLLAAPVWEFHYYQVLLLPMTVLIVLAGDERDAFLQAVSRAALVVFAILGLLTLGSNALQKVGLMCWLTLGLWAVLLLAATRQTQD